MRRKSSERPKRALYGAERSLERPKRALYGAKRDLLTYALYGAKRDLLTCAGRGAELPSLVKAALLAREKRLDECSALLQVPQKSSTMSKRALPGAKAPYERAILTVASAAVRDGEPDDSAARQAHAGTAAAPAGNGVLLQVLL